MDHRTLEIILNKTTKTVFTTQDFNKYWQYENYNSLIQRLNYMRKTGKIQRVKRGLYSIKGREINELELANRVRTPSYISFETVLHREGIVFQWDRRVTAASQISREFEVLGIPIVYRKMKDEILLNSEGVLDKETYFMAEKERAFLDMLYVNLTFAFDNLRGINFDRVAEILPVYKRKTLEDKVRELREYAESY